MDQFLEKYNHNHTTYLYLTLDETDNLNCLIAIKEISLTILKLTPKSFHWMILPNVYKKNNDNTTKSL